MTFLSGAANVWQMTAYYYNFNHRNELKYAIVAS